MSRWFKRKPLDCNFMQVGFNPNKPEKGLDIWLGVNESCNIAYHHLGLDELNWLIDYLSGIRDKMTTKSE